MPKTARCLVSNSMARSAKALRIIYPEEQNYACRECPARCCRTPWGIPVAPEVAHRILQDEELRRRLVGRAPGILAGGTLPMIESERKLQCVFLEDDLLCGVQKRHGHSALPAACQAYPFGFVEDERGNTVTLLSRHCPSIRDNYGEPLLGQIQAKVGQAGGARALSDRMGLRSGRTLPRAQYLMLVDAWRELCSSQSPITAVLSCYALADHFDEALSGGSVFTDAQVHGALQQARQRTAVAALTPRRHPNFQARLFYAHELGNLCYPSRLLTEFAVTRPSWSQRVGSWQNKWNWLLQVGKVDLLYVAQPVRLRHLAKVPPFLEGELGNLVRNYLVEVLERRQVFVRQTYLTRVAVDLGLMVGLISRFARASAVGHGRLQVVKADVLEGMGVSDLLMAHQADARQSTVLANLRLHLMSTPAAVPRFLASEAGPFVSTAQ